MTKFHFRLAMPEDAAPVQAIYAPHCRTHTSFEAEPPSVEEMARRIRGTLECYPWLVCEAEGVVAAYCYASTHRERAAYRWCVETTIYAHPEYHGRGIGRALYTSLFAVLALQGYVNALAGIALPNPASLALHQSLGFTAVGTYPHIGCKGGAWHDVLWMQRLVQPLPPHPAEPRPLAEVRDAAEWQAAVGSGLALLRF